MARTQTGYTGIVVQTNDTDSKKFVGLVKAALDKINSKPVGKALLDGIAAETAKDRFGYLVCIKPNPSTKQSFGPLIRWRTYEKGSVTVSANDQSASDGTGVTSMIKWDPQNCETPDGARPPYIALAHELIHCYWNLRGESHVIGGEDEKKIDEMRVVGLRGYEQLPICENRIRKEHGIAYRSSYFGRCDKADGAPDKTKFA